MLAFAAVDKISAVIVARTCALVSGGDTIVLYEPTSFASLQAYQAYLQQASLVKAAYSGFALPMPVTPPPKGNAPAALAEVVSTITQLATATTSQSPSSITIPDGAIVMRLANDLLRGGCPNKDVSGATKILTIVYPPFTFSVSDEEQVKETNAVAKTIEEVVSAKRAAEKAFRDGNYPSDGQESANLKAANDLYTSFIQSLNAINQTNGLPAFAGIVQGYQLAQVVNKETTYVLIEQSIAAGGTMQDRKNLLSSLTTGDWISYSGGAIVGFAVVKGGCKAIGGLCNPLQLVDVLRYRTPLTRIQNPGNVDNIREGDNFAESGDSGAPISRPAGATKSPAPPKPGVQIVSPEN